MNNYPKYQISVFHDGQGRGQSVFRTESEEEYKEQCKKWGVSPLIGDKREHEAQVQRIVEANTTKPDPTDTWPKGNYDIRPNNWKPGATNVTADDYEDKHICPAHNTPMKEGVSKTKKDENGNFIKYWSHSKKEGDKWSRCFGKGWK